ncbi:hypothetical protein KIN20_008843 [Parelaphostrongylus tenuis]|uniref:Uncharacterized protein n=1 Tax=Parelaphostrongylus tenuis TaxID=148309 RepID=A0AAD5MX41_PARTN|nr:hypothetical protein KIN20_008843 [Parelaphostrongylus tenuis]
MKSLGVDPACGVLDPEEVTLMAVSCDTFEFGHEGRKEMKYDDTISGLCGECGTVAKPTLFGLWQTSFHCSVESRPEEGDADSFRTLFSQLGCQYSECFP